MNRDLFVQAFRRHANEIVSRYGVPVFLCGSALRTEEPRDIDVLVILTEKELYRLYGRISAEPRPHQDFADWEWRRARDRIKQSRALGSWWGYPIDFKIETEGEAAAYKSDDKFRLDSAPDWVFQ